MSPVANQPSRTRPRSPRRAEVAPVAAHDVRAADHDLAVLAGGHVVAVGPTMRISTLGTGLPDRARARR